MLENAFLKRMVIGTLTGEYMVGYWTPTAHGANFMLSKTGYNDWPVQAPIPHVQVDLTVDEDFDAGQLREYLRNRLSIACNSLERSIEHSKARK